MPRPSHRLYVGTIGGCVLMWIGGAANYLVEWKPWRLEEAVVLGCVGLGGAWFLTYAMRHRRVPRRVWGFINVLALGLVVAAYVGTAHFHRPASPFEAFAEESMNAVDEAGGLLPYFANKPRLPGAIPLLGYVDPWSFPASDSVMAADLMQGQVSLSGYPTKDIGSRLSWSDHLHPDHRWVRRLHEVSFIRSLLTQYTHTQEEAYLQRAEDLVLSWARKNTSFIVFEEVKLPWNTVFSYPSAHTWGDRITAARLLNFMAFWDVWIHSSLATEDEAEQVLGLLFLHAHKLATPAFYNDEHNHGMDQDLALLVFSAVFPEHGQHRAWQQVGHTRLRAQLAFLISPTYVQREHSPSYHFSTFAHLAEYGTFIQAMAQTTAHADAHADADLEDMLKQMVPHLTLFVRPDGHLAPFGDSGIPDASTQARQRLFPLSANTSVLTPFLADNPSLAYVLSNGQQGTPPPRFTALVEDGYGAIRDYSTPFSTSLYVAITTASDPEADHWQDHALSFVASSCGQDVIVDPGRQKFSSSDPYSEHVQSRAAHNVVLVPDEDGDGVRGSIRGRAAIVSVVDTANVVGASASVDLEGGVRHKRAVLYLGEGTVLLMDRVDGEESGVPASFEMTQRFHLHPDLDIDIEEEGTRLEVAREGKRALVLMPVGEEGVFSITRVPPAVDWAVDYTQGLPGLPTVVDVKQQGSERSAVTLLQLPVCEAGQMEAPTLPQVTYTTADSSLTVQVHYEQVAWEILMQEGGVLSLRQTAGQGS